MPMSNTFLACMYFQRKEQPLKTDTFSSTQVIQCSTSVPPHQRPATLLDIPSPTRQVNTKSASSIPIFTLQDSGMSGFLFVLCEGDQLKLPTICRTFVVSNRCQMYSPPSIVDGGFNSTYNVGDSGMPLLLVRIPLCTTSVTMCNILSPSLRSSNVIAVNSNGPAAQCPLPLERLPDHFMMARNTAEANLITDVNCNNLEDRNCQNPDNEK